MNKKKIVIFGAGGHGKVVLDILLKSKLKVLGFLDDDAKKINKKVLGFKILGDRSYLIKNKTVSVALGIGGNVTREKIFKKVKSLGIEIVSAIHPQAIIAKGVKIGEGVVIMPGVIIGPSVVLKEGVVINTSASVDHDCYLNRFCQIWPGAHLAGSVTVGEFSYVGTGASVIQNINIGKNVMIGAGAAVIRNIPDSVTCVGVPAKIIKR